MERYEWRERPDGDNIGERHAFVLLTSKLIIERLNSACFPRLEADPYFVALDLERERLENELAGILGPAVKVKTEQYIRVRMRCEAFKAGHAYCQGLVDGAFFAELFTRPVEGGNALNKDNGSGSQQPEKLCIYSSPGGGP
jgi:hypothetical protein